jgi:ubiquinone/menaquinone biosynthesis C-methylase UbiE
MSSRSLPPSILAASLVASSFACASPSDAGTQAPGDARDQGDHGHHDHGEGHHAHQGHQGHQGQGHGGVNEHGYKGHRFDDPEQWTAQFESAERTEWQKPDELIASLGLAPDTTIADLGAGTGYFAVRFAAAAPSGTVYAVDIEPNMVAWLAQRAEQAGLHNLEAVQATPEDPELPGAVELVFMCNVFHHLADPKAYFEAVAGKLEPGGRVVIVDFKFDNPDDAPGPPAAMRMRAEQIVEIMASAGYSLARQDDELLAYQVVLDFSR